MFSNAYKIYINYSSGCWIINTPFPDKGNGDWQTPLWLSIKEEIKKAHHRLGLSDKHKFVCGYKTKEKVNGWIAKEESFKALSYIVNFAEKEGIVVKFERGTEDKLKSLLAYEERGRLADKDIPAEFIEGLKSFPDDGQYTAIKFIDDANGRALIGSEPGWGKSVVGLGWCELRKKKAIIFCPSQRSKTKKNWAHEVSKHTHHKAYVMYGSADIDMARLLDSNYIIVNYDIVGDEDVQYILKSLIATWGYDTGIFDESHKLKNNKTNRYKDIEPFIRLLEHRIELSATSMENKTLDLQPQLHIVAPERFPSREEFKFKYCGGARRAKDGSWHGVRQTKEQLNQLKEDIKGIYFYRKMDNIVDLHKEVRRIDSPEAKMVTGNKITQYERLIRLMVPHTIEFTNKILETDALLKTHNKVIVYTGRIEVAEMLHEAFGDISCITHGGNAEYPMTSKEADEQFREFIKNDDKRIMVATYQSFSESINLHHISNIVIFNDLPPTASKTEQGWGRVKRRGQTDKCYAFFMSFNGTYYENTMLKRVEKKAKPQKKVLTNRDTHDSFLHELDSKGEFTKLKQGQLFAA